MEYDQHGKNRLKRIVGQVKRWIKHDRAGGNCREIVTQLSAAHSV